MLSPLVIGCGALVGFVVGLTGMGGGALMTPILVLLFGIDPLAAVSSDLVASMIMKPVGGAVHWRRGTVNRPLVGWLMLGSVPSAFAGVLLLRQLGTGTEVQRLVKLALGIALLVVSLGLVVRPLLAARRAQESEEGAVVVRPIPTLMVGILGGIVVGLTSVGSGSLMIIALLMLYPRLKLKELVGTDLVQAIPLVGSAAFGHLLFGDFRLSLTASILIGAIPGVFLGARFSSRAPDHVVRPALLCVLLLSGLKLLGTPNAVLAAVIPLVIAGAVGLSIRKMRSSRARARAAQPELAAR